MIINILIVLGFFVLMEAAAWFTHKYIMHGFMWVWHKSHHEPRHGVLERNDLFSVVFSIPSIVLIAIGYYEQDWKLYAGIGIALYGLAYFLVHDVFVHQRIKWLQKTKVPYFKAMRQTHYLHHTFHKKEGAKAFGFIFVRPSFLKKYKNV